LENMRMIYLYCIGTQKQVIGILTHNQHKNE